MSRSCQLCLDPQKKVEYYCEECSSCCFQCSGCFKDEHQNQEHNYMKVIAPFCSKFNILKGLCKEFVSIGFVRL